MPTPEPMASIHPRPLLVKEGRRVEFHFLPIARHSVQSPGAKRSLP